MKKILIIATLLISTQLLIKAENPTPLSFGIKAGYTYSDINTVKSLTTKSLTAQNMLSTLKSDGSNGSVFGAYVRISGEKFYFQPELRYVTLNSDFSNLVEEAVSPYRGEIKITTLDIPLQAGYRVINLPAFKIRLFFGPCASIKIDNKLDFKDNVESFIAIAQDDFNSLNWSLYGGVGLDKLRFNLDIAFLKGLTDVSETYFEKPSVFMVTLGFAVF